MGVYLNGSKIIQYCKQKVMNSDSSLSPSFNYFDKDKLMKIGDTLEKLSEALKKSRY